MLSELTFEVTYRSDRQDLVRDFYEPCLYQARIYRRAVGYFSSHGLVAAASGIAALAVNEGRVRLVASPKLVEDDIAAFRLGYNSREKLMTVCAREFEDIRDELARDRLSALAWMIARGLLEVRLALRVDANGYLRGIYHEKIGIFEDTAGNQVAFSGSSNETQGGLIDNFETTDVYWSWDDPQKRVARKYADFEELWENRTSGVEVIDFTEATEEILKAYKSVREPDWESMLTPGLRKARNNAAAKWRHQEEAVRTFIEKERGILEMATGTGKTRTALRICELLLRRGDIDTIIVATDGVDLLEQWRLQLVELTTKVNRRFALYRQYGGNHERGHFSLSPINSIFLTSRPALTPALRDISSSIASRTILIHDEAHRAGSAGNRESLSGASDQIRFRLGLSATPEREYDAEGNQFVEQHIGPVIFRFGLEQAIRRGILAPFNYYPLHYLPDADDHRKLKQVFTRKTQREKAGNPMSNEEFWTELARVHKTSRAKQPVFHDFITRHQELLSNTIIFVETKEYGEEVLDIVHQFRHDFHPYYGEENPGVLRRFARGDIACLITCHRLSEGIDIRSLETVILFASSRAKLETIQRIGRCLRSDPRNPVKRANVVDFIRDAQPDDDVPEADDERCAWLTDLSNINPET